MRDCERDSLQMRLFEAVFDRSPERTHEALRDGANPNVRDHDHPDLWRLFSLKPSGSFLLYEIVSMSRRRKIRPESLDTMRSLIEHHADVKMADDHGYTALHQAAAFNQVDALKLLLDSGAQINAKSEKGYSPLHTAIFGGSEDCAMVLLKAGADIKSTNGQGITPLQYACKLDRTDLRAMIESHLAMDAIAQMLTNPQTILLVSGHSLHSTPTPNTRHC